jgi:hypothetical protein
VRLVGGARPGKSEEPIDHRRTQHSPQQHREAREAAAVCVSVCSAHHGLGRTVAEGGRTSIARHSHCPDETPKTDHEGL